MCEDMIGASDPCQGGMPGENALLDGKENALKEEVDQLPLCVE